MPLMEDDGASPIFPPLQLDRAQSGSRGMTLAAQITAHIQNAIVEGAILPGSRLPSWRDLAAQLGVARGTVRAAYEVLADRGYARGNGAAGTYVADPLPVVSKREASAVALPSIRGFRLGPEPPRVFQMGVPAHDAFPATLWARLHRSAVRTASLQTGYSDPYGMRDLRVALAAHVGLARGVECSPEQVIVTTGYRAGLAMVLRAIGAAGRQAWIEDPGFPVARRGLELSGVCPVPIPVDEDGIRVSCGRAMAPHAALAIVTPGQQAPTGVVLAPERREALLRWAAEADAWIVEDDYLAELQLEGRLAPALAAGAGAERVIYVATFSKTIAPMVGLGFIVAPKALARRLMEVATWLGAPPDIAVQIALTSFLREGHYFRHLRRMRDLYAGRRRLLLDTLAAQGVAQASVAGLSVLLFLPDSFDDERLALEASTANLGPAPLSPWFASASRARAGLILGVANVKALRVAQNCEALLRLVGRRL